MSGARLSAPAAPGKSTSMERRKQTPEDFLFGRLIGDGSFSSVFLAREVATGREFAIKVCDKSHIIKEKKQEYIASEKKILVKIASEWDERVPFFVKIYSTFQDASRLYFVMTYAKNGDLLRFIDDMAKKDIDCTQYYASQLLVAVEWLHQRGILHRDLKPENILLNEKMQILLTDFGSAKLLPEHDGDPLHEDTGEPQPKRSSFVGTAQYVSPEILSGRGSTRASDLWAIGCILYQMLTGLPPFQSQSEYLIFQKINKLEYSFHEGFNEHAKHLIQRLLVIEPDDRLGANDKTPYSSIRAHPFFSGVDFERLHDPAYLPASVAHNCGVELSGGGAEDPCWARNPSLQPGAANLNRLLIEDPCEDREEFSDLAIGRGADGALANLSDPSSPSSSAPQRRRGHIVDLTDEERKKRLDEQIRNNKFHRFVEGNLILKQGILDKKKGLWSRRRMFLLTEGPHLYYVDPDNMVLKGEIPWCETIRPEIRDFKIFFVHTPNRVYYLIDPESKAKVWCNAIQEVRRFYYGDLPGGQAENSISATNAAL